MIAGYDGSPVPASASQMLWGKRDGWKAWWFNPKLWLDHLPKTIPQTQCGVQTSPRFGIRKKKWVQVLGQFTYYLCVFWGRFLKFSELCWFCFFHLEQGLANRAHCLFFTNEVCWIQPYLFVCILPLAAFMLQWQNWVAVTEIIWLTNPNVFALWPFTEKVCLCLDVDGGILDHRGLMVRIMWNTFLLGNYETHYKCYCLKLWYIICLWNPFHLWGWKQGQDFD